MVPCGRLNRLLPAFENDLDWWRVNENKSHNTFTSSVVSHFAAVVIQHTTTPLFQDDLGKSVTERQNRSGL